MAEVLVIPVIHNVSSVQRVVDMARLVYGLGLKTLIVTKAYGAAAQSGIPEAMRLALKNNRSLIVLPELSDAVDLVKPDKVLIVTVEHAKKLIDPSGQLELGSRTLVVFSGSEQGFTPSELSLGEPVYIKGVEARLGAVAEASIILYHLLFNLKGRGP